MCDFLTPQSHTSPVGMVSLAKLAIKVFNQQRCVILDNQEASKA